MRGANGNLAKNKDLKYYVPAAFDRQMVKLQNKFKILDDLVLKDI